MKIRSSEIDTSLFPLFSYRVHHQATGNEASISLSATTLSILASLNAARAAAEKPRDELGIATVDQSSGLPSQHRAVEAEKDGYGRLWPAAYLSSLPFSCCSICWIVPEGSVTDKEDHREQLYWGHYPESTNFGNGDIRDIIRSRRYSILATPSRIFSIPATRVPL